MVLAYGGYILANAAFYWNILAETPDKRIIFGSLAVVIIGPPIWFVIEYWWLVSPKWRNDEKLRNVVKIEQDFFRNIWLAVATFALATLAFFKATIIGP